ncbi:unnamed protein product [Arctia plantaginis]|uniref:Ubiquinol-cytochrome C reductase hinge domain-containing protein n=1 Tax=Arctia plantaginis TaxID=874455 RepID=A0A8S1BF46_ARCPL|nr:unnamed protein product [Arctia plantaginis]CAB3258448.1 unnamed protein product [Arctia plantaginis]
MEEKITVRMFDKESTDQLTRERGICLATDCNVRKYFLELRECTRRVTKKPFTAETCHQETVDLIEALDKCISNKAFMKIR